MSLSDPNKIIDLRITYFPQHLIVPSQEGNKISFQATNYSNKPEDFQFIIRGENLDIKVPDELLNTIRFNSGESKQFSIDIIPKIDGSGKLILTINWMKIEQEIVKVQKLRESVPESKIDTILGKIKTFSASVSQTFIAYNYINKCSPEDVKKLEEELEIKRKEYASFQLLNQARTSQSMTLGDNSQGGFVNDNSFGSSLNSLDSAISDAAPSITEKDIDKAIKNLAMAYLGIGDFKKAIQLIEDLSDEDDKQKFKTNLIRAYSSINLDEVLGFINSLSEGDYKNNLLRQIALDLVNKDPERASRIALLIESPIQKDNLLKEIISLVLNENPQITIKLSHLLDDIEFKMNLLFNIAKKFYEKGLKQDLTDLFQQISEHLINSTKFDLKKDNYLNPYYEMLKDALYCLAEVSKPGSSENIILSLQDNELKEKLALDLFNTLYEMVDEVRTKVVPTLVVNQFYTLNTYISNINKNILDFSAIGGNVSSNLLSGDFNFGIMIISLFGYKNFGIFPTLDRIYMDFSFSGAKPFGYYIFPSNNAHDEIEIEIITETLKQFFRGFSGIKMPLIIFNTDFIPYLGKPTVIISSDEVVEKKLETLISGKMANNVDVLIDNDFFEGGKSNKMLKEIFPLDKCKVVNLILSYEFLNNYNEFKNLIELLNQNNF
ncbi:MAG: hypothetical protein ACTSVV_07000 [Promethearchaeota archaeon]